MKYRVSVEFKGKLGYTVIADSKEEASSDVALKFIERDIKNSNLNEFIDECTVYDVQEVE
jgi:hypothetical protein